MSSLWRESLRDRQATLRQQSLWRERRLLESPQQALVTLQGKRLVNFSSNDYLGLASHPKMLEASQKAAQQWGVSSGSSHLVCGHQAPHHELELALADFVGAEKTLLFSTGYMANLALPAALLGKHDLALQDKLNHASLIDGAKLSSAQLKRYRHSDVANATQLLERAEFEKVMISTDGVFSMDGDIALLPELKQLADQNNGLLYVDDAHGLGVLGEQGKGSLEVHELQAKDNVLLLGTLGKAFGSFGAFVAGDALFVDQLIQSARPYIYTTALPPTAVATSHQALLLIQKEGVAYRQKLSELLTYFKAGVQNLGLNLMPSNTPIQPLLIGDEEKALALSDYLFEQGFLVSAIRPPTVPKGTSRLRFTFSATHELAQVEQLLDVLSSQSVRQILEGADSE